MQNWRIGHGYDVHKLAGVREQGEQGEQGGRELREREQRERCTLRLGGVSIPHSKRCVAHSDGDAVIHALCDALLGAAALGDIGLHFPDTSEEYRGIDSLELLRRTAAIIRCEGYEIGNADCTIVLQTPKVRPYIDRMRRAMAEAMGIPQESVSVKATTTEGLGFAGREEGVEAHAVAIIRK